MPFRSRSTSTFQSTHSRGVRPDQDSTSVISLGFQSTHSRGVRHLEPIFYSEVLKYFNPRTHEECDNTFLSIGEPKCYFNPRTHEECDGIGKGTLPTHAKFQSTHSRGVRHLNLPHYKDWYIISIHALTRSATLQNTQTGTDKIYFNPRTHEECDLNEENISDD